MSILAAFPAEWRCDVTVKDGGGVNSDGDPVEPTTHVLADCMVGPRATRDPVDHSEVDETTAALYAAPRAAITSTSTVIVPASHFMAGEYTVDGRPGFWPLGTEVSLRRV